MPLKQAIIQAISKLDIEKLELLLDDSKTYQDTTKEIFLRNLNNKVFKKFKEEGETELIAYNGMCDDSKCNKGCKGFLFVGSNVKHHTAFIFKETQEEINDIYYCSNFKCDTVVENLKKNFWLQIAYDELLNFKPTVEHHIKVQKCDKAVSQIINKDVDYFIADDYLQWVNIHKELYQSLTTYDLGLECFATFKDLIEKFKSLGDLLEFETQSTAVLNQFSKLNCNNEPQLLDFLLDNEDFYRISILVPLSYFKNVEQLLKGTIILTSEEVIKIDIEPHKNVFKVVEIFLKYYWELIEKYFSYPSNSEFEKDPYPNERDKLSSLRFHLNRRKDAALLGKEYPFYILRKSKNENNLLKETINDSNPNLENATNNIETIQEPTKAEVAASIKNEQQHYYIVKEILTNKTTDAVISTNEYEFANKDLHTSKLEARLFYDNKVATCLNKDENSVFQYELYIVNNVFFDVKNTTSTSEVSTNDIKKYLLIDSAGKTQTEGRNFESFALSIAANKMNKKPYNNNNQVYCITTKNSFLDGNYKD